MSDLMTVRDVAGKLGVHPNTVRSRIKDGSLRAKRMGGHRLIIEQSELRRYVDDLPSALDDRLSA